MAYIYGIGTSEYVENSRDKEAKAETNSLLDSIIKMGASNPLGLSTTSVEETLNRFTTSLLGGKTEAQLDAGQQTLLGQGKDIANRMLARINSAQQAQNSPGSAAQTRKKQSLLG